MTEWIPSQGTVQGLEDQGGCRDVDAMVRCLHYFVVDGIRDQEVVRAMSVYGYDEVRWAEGEQLLAELISSDRAEGPVLSRASTWYDHASQAALAALDGRPTSLARLGLADHPFGSPRKTIDAVR